MMYFALSLDIKEVKFIVNFLSDLSIRTLESKLGKNPRILDHFYLTKKSCYPPHLTIQRIVFF